MVPSSIQWTSTPSVHILVYPISRYVISPAEKPPPGTTARRRVQSLQQRSSVGPTSGIVRGKSRARRSLPNDFGSRRHGRSQQHRRTRTYPAKRSPNRRRNSCTGSASRYERRSGSRDACGGFPSAIHRRDEPARDRKQERYWDADIESVEEEEEEEEEEVDVEAEVEVEDSDYDGDDDNVNDNKDEDEDDGDGCDEGQRDREDEQNRSDDVDGCNGGGVARVVSAVDDTITCSRRPRPLVGETKNRAMRCSANVVLLAHGNRSLYVLTIQRNQVTSVVGSTSPSSRYRNHRPSSTTVISYKLPGGQFIPTNDEHKNYHKDSGNTCTCPDDQLWYSAAINHFMTQLTTRDGPTTTAATRQSGDDRPQFVALGNWYRTQQDDGPQHGHRWRSNSNYYPYKPAHVSRRLAGHKRVYAVPDAFRLFPGTEQPTFRLQTPRAKTKTAVATTKTATAKIKTATTYKCKFVPLARLHENSRLYGPVLSSLPTILSGMNLIFSP